MKTKICYEANDLMPKLAKFGYSFGKLPISEEDEEWPSHDSTAYYFFKPEVKKIEYFYQQSVENTPTSTSDARKW